MRVLAEHLRSEHSARLRLFENHRSECQHFWQASLNRSTARVPSSVKSMGYKRFNHVYQNAHTFAYHIGQYAVDKNGLLTGPIDNALIQWLADEGFSTEE